MQSDSGLLRWLKFHFLHNLFQDAVGANAFRRKSFETMFGLSRVIR